MRRRSLEVTEAILVSAVVKSWWSWEPNFVTSSKSARNPPGNILSSKATRYIRLTKKKLLSKNLIIEVRDGKGV